MHPALRMLRKYRSKSSPVSGTTTRWKASMPRPAGPSRAVDQQPNAPARVAVRLHAAAEAAAQAVAPVRHALVALPAAPGRLRQAAEAVGTAGTAADSTAATSDRRRT